MLLWEVVIGSPSTNPFTSATQSGYNATPPPDDGTENSANAVKWATIKDKLADPNKTYVDDTNTNASTAFGSVLSLAANVRNDIEGQIAFGSSELTIASGTITATRSYHTVDTEADASTDDLANIDTSSSDDGARLTIRAANTGRTVVVKHAATGAGEIHLSDATDFSLDDDAKVLTLYRNGTDWYEHSRSVSLGAATQAEMETATSTTTTVTPGRAHFHPGSAKAWVAFSGGTPTVDASYNVTSITDNGTGDFTINWDTDFSSVNYAVAGIAQRAATNDSFMVAQEQGTAKTAAGITVKTLSGGGTIEDPGNAYVVAFGDH